MAYQARLQGNKKLVRKLQNIYETIAEVGQEFAELAEVNEIWLLGTMSWNDENSVNFARVWPNLAFGENGALRIVREVPRGGEG
jgi:hypothetical protein